MDYLIAPDLAPSEGESNPFQETLLGGSSAFLGPVTAAEPALPIAVHPGALSSEFVNIYVFGNPILASFLL